MTPAAQALRAAIPRLTAAGLAEPAKDARYLMAHALQVPYDRLMLHLPDPLTPEAAERFEAAIAARLRHQPVAQIIGWRDFWGRRFRVTPDTLDPRPETEILVAEALARPFVRMLDLGTGTGCILLSCLADRPMATGLGVDISAAALEVARDNAQNLGLSARARFALSDWCSALSGQFDLIVSNPPYIAAEEMSGLAPDVRDWEPHLALSPGGDGLEAYRRICRDAPSRLMAGGRLIVEIGPSQGAAVQELMRLAGLVDLQVLPDWDGRDRVVRGQKPMVDETGSACPG